MTGKWMRGLAFFSICIGASCGALLRWGLGNAFNHIFPTIPLGTLTANILGGFLMGIFMQISHNHSFFPEVLRLAIATGFLGGLTTFSTFSAETVTLLSHLEYFMAAVLIIGHVVGSVFATIFGIYLVKLLIS